MNPYNHSIELAAGVRPAGMLRHSRAHRAKLRSIEAEKVTVVCARYEPRAMDFDRDAREIVYDLTQWAKRKGGTLIRAISEHAGPSCASPFVGVRCMQVFTVRGPIALPTDIKGWKLTKATAKEETWAKTRPVQ